MAARSHASADDEHGVAPTADRQPSIEALTSLAERLRGSRILMEHQLFEAARLLQDAGLLAVDLRHDATFRRIMEARRFLEAVRLLAENLAGTATPEAMSPPCAMAAAHGGIHLTTASGHQDPPAAALIQLVNIASLQLSSSEWSDRDVSHAKSS